MSQIDTTRTWVPGESVDAAKMNDIIDQAIAKDALITDQTAFGAGTVDPDNDMVLLYVAAGGALHLRKTPVKKLPAGVTSIQVLALPTAVFGVTPPTPITVSGAYTLSLKNQLKNLFLCGPVSGTTAATPTFRAIAPADTSSMITLTGATPNIIDCTLGNVFSKGLTSNMVFKVNNGVAGQRITVYLKQQNSPYNFTVSWGTDDLPGLGKIRWPRTATSGIWGEPHTMTVGSAGRSDIVSFLCTEPGLYWGTFNKDFVEQGP